MTPTRPLPPDLRLARGRHEPPNGEFAACIVEAAAWVAGEPWTDHPECVCPVVATFCREWNDALPDEPRQILLPYVERIVGTYHGPEVGERRAWMATDWLVRECAPAWLRLAGLHEHAHTLERLAVLESSERACEARPSVDAAKAAAWGAGGYAAWAAWAAWAAAGAAAWGAARGAAGYAAWAAGYAAWAAGDAARGAAEDRLRPTVEALQVSALRLLDRMLEVRP